MTNEWAAKAVEKLQQKPFVEVGQGIVSVPECLKLIRRAQAQERARWRKAIKTLLQPGLTFYGRAYNQALADLAQAMNGRKG